MEVKNCPFCGTKPMFERGYTEVDDNGEGKITVPFRLFCPECGAQMRKESRFAVTDNGNIVTLKNGYMDLLTKWNWREKE